MSAMRQVGGFKKTAQPHGSPWGKVELAEELAPGIWFVSTPGHGGIQVSPERWAAMPEPLRCNPYGKGHWFEEDCEALLPAIAFWSEMPAWMRENWTAELVERSFSLGGSDSPYAGAVAYAKKAGVGPFGGAA